MGQGLRASLHPLPFGAHEMNLAVHATSLPSYGIALTSSADTEFNSIVRSIFKGNADELLRLSPYLVIVTNQSARTMVAYTLLWEIKRAKGSETHYSHYKYPDAI